MENFLSWLEDKQWLNLIFLSLAVLSIIISIYLYRKSRKRKKPVFDIRSTNVLSDDIQLYGDIIIKFKGNKIDNLTVTKLAFWNSGNETINDIDQAPTDLLKAELKDGYKILEAEVLFQSKESNNIKIVSIENEICIKFDFFDENEGGIIKLIHTGKKSSDISLKGTFKGSDKLKQISYSPFTFNLLFNFPFIGSIFPSTFEKKIFTTTFPWVAIFTGIILSTTYFFVESDSEGKVVLLVLGLFYALIGIISVFQGRTYPKGFEIFLDDE